MVPMAQWLRRVLGVVGIATVGVGVARFVVPEDVAVLGGLGGYGATRSRGDGATG